MKSTKSLVTLVAVFAPFGVFAFAMALSPSGTFNSLMLIDFIWLFALSAMMLALYYFLAIHLVDKDHTARKLAHLGPDPRPTPMIRSVSIS
jgi:heme/copper-type cytochrome/quinol oxidase subunit 4